MKDTKHAPIRDALRVREFRVLWLTEALSVFGDQLARVALALLVYARTNSALLTALTYALTFVPAVLGGFLLSGLADRFPRRTVIVVTDAIRGCLAAAMAIPGVPLPVLWVLVGLLTLAGAPFKGAQLALLSDVLPEQTLQAGLGLRQMSSQIAQVAGFGLGGVLVTAWSASASLVLNAATFFLSAVLVLVFIQQRLAAAAEAGSGERSGRGKLDGRIVAVALLAGLTGLLVVPEGLAAPFASAAGVGSFGVGLLMASDPIGSVVGGWWAAHRQASDVLSAKAVVLPAVLAGVPLVLCAWLPGVWWAAALWAVTGMLSTVYIVRMVAAVRELVPDSRRATVMGRLTTVLYSSQGVAILLGGVVAEQVGPVGAVALSGTAAVVAATGTGLVWQATRPRRARSAADEPAPVIAA